MQKVKPIDEEKYLSICKFNREMMESFLADSSEKSPKSLKSYASNLKIFFVWVAENLQNKKIVDIKPLEWKRFQNWLIGRDCSSSDIRNKRSAVSSLCQYIETYMLDDFPTFRSPINKSIKAPPQVRKHEKVPLTKAEVEHLINTLKEMGEWQKAAFVQFTFDVGCRKAESLQILKSVIDLEPVIRERNGKRNVYYKTHDVRCKGSGKTGEVRGFKFSEATMETLKKWMEIRGEDDCPYLFAKKIRGQMVRLGETTPNEWCKLFSEITGKRVYIHLLRASRATSIVVEEGRDVKVAQKLLAHKDVSTTEGFYIIRDESELADELYDEE